MHHKEAVSTTRAPGAIGPYSQGIHCGNFVFTSGQLPIDPETKKVAEDIQEQASVALSNVKAILEEAGASLQDVVKVTVFLLNIQDFATVNEVYKEFFEDSLPFPARSAVQVAALPGPVGCKLEIEAVAVIKK